MQSMSALQAEVLFPCEPGHNEKLLVNTPPVNKLAQTMDLYNMLAQAYVQLNISPNRIV